ncbi:porin [Azospirillum lipoferum]|uniref:Major outer membrane protein OmaA n=1 Tax=Azospirillum lipoferum (strain 4B) TaxID=862719 RepID=G7ZIG4_AZOL4|nr:porin [Azospirillum lipoferum]CBS91366.1 Major outer membrane protein OmaA [Azospirillum lipoferum 4B]
MVRSALLLGAATLSLVSVLGVTPAFAQSKFDVVLGGDAYFEAGYVDQDRDAGLRSTEFRNRLRLLVTPKAKADNGLEYGARLRLLAENGAGNARSTGYDRAFLFVQGGFGTVHMGVENGPSDDSGIIAPSDWGTGGVDGSFPSWLGNSATNAPVTIGNIRALISGNSATRATYWTPEIAGFKLGASYQPSSDSSGTDVNRSKVALASANRTGAYRDVYEVGGTYANSFGGVAVNASLFYLGGKAKESSTTAARFDDLSSTHAGLTVAYGGLKVGGSYAWSGDSGYAKSSTAGIVSREKQDVWTVGAQYTFGPTTLGVGYLNAKDAGDLTVRGRSKFELITVGARYVVAPGFSVGPEYNHFKLSSDVAANSDKGDMFLIQTNLAF